jgi:hypothetical protein
MRKFQLQEVDEDELMHFIGDLKGKLRKKTEDLTRTRARLQKARSNIQRLKGIIAYQRGRILSIYAAGIEKPLP